MKIILGKENAESMRDKYLVLELDTIQFATDAPSITAYCLVEPKALEELTTMNSFIELHAKLIENYQKKNWKFCSDAIEHLLGKWNGDVDSFYRELLNRINNYKSADLPSEWTGVIKKY